MSYVTPIVDQNPNHYSIFFLVYVAQWTGRDSDGCSKLNVLLFVLWELVAVAGDKISKLLEVATDDVKWQGDVQDD